MFSIYLPLLHCTSLLYCTRLREPCDHICNTWRELNGENNVFILGIFDWEFCASRVLA